MSERSNDAQLVEMVMPYSQELGRAIMNGDSANIVLLTQKLSFLVGTHPALGVLVLVEVLRAVEDARAQKTTTTKLKGL